MESFIEGCFAVTRTGIDYQKGSHQFLNWWQQYATGILH